MIEVCPARSVEPGDISGFIPEVRLPEACLRCIHRALEDPSIPRETTDTYEQGLAFVRQKAEAPNAAADEFNSWQEIAMKPPLEGLGRQALIEHGFDVGLNFAYDTTSYVPGSETEVTNLPFDCYEEAR